MVIVNRITSIKKYLLKFNGYQLVGIFANGSIQNMDKYHNSSQDDVKENNDNDTPFVEGFASKVDVFGIKQLTLKKYNECAFWLELIG